MTDSALAEEFLAAKWFSEGGNLSVRRIVLHTTEGGNALTVAKMFAAGVRLASAHYVLDATNVIQCVHERDVAYHAPPNARTIGVEICGWASWTPTEWAEHEQEVSLAARLTEDIAYRCAVPLTWLEAGDLKANRLDGVSTHAATSEAFGLSSHWDPGPNFPVEHFMDLVRSYRAEREGLDMTPEELRENVRTVFHEEFGKSGTVTRRGVTKSVRAGLAEALTVGTDVWASLTALVKKAVG
jgi:N-acetyl-anhydromuramyl-L-alanine amidase AmpD